MFFETGFFTVLDFIPSFSQIVLGPLSLTDSVLNKVVLFETFVFQVFLRLVFFSIEKFSLIIPLIEEAKNKGLQVFGETCPQYLLLDESLLNNSFYDSAPYVLSPALRTKHHQDELWKGLKNGTLSTIGTDHCPFNLYGQKDMGKNDFTLIPNGAGGVEHRLELLYTYGVLTNKLSLEKWVELTIISIVIQIFTKVLPSMEKLKK